MAEKILVVDEQTGLRREVNHKLTAKEKAWLKKYIAKPESGIFYIRWDGAVKDRDVMYLFDGREETVDSLRKFRKDCITHGRRKGLTNSRPSDGSNFDMS